MKILVTGANGFLGKNVCRALVRDHIIYAVKRPGSVPDAKTDLQCIHLDLAKKLNIEDFPNDIEVIMHFAQSNQYKNFPENAKDIFDINIQSTFNLLELARRLKIKKFIYTSTGGVYGYNSKEAFEQDDLKPLDDELNFYSVSKMAAESFVNSYSPFFTTMILRPFFIYGPNQQSDRLIPQLIHSIKNNLPIKLNGKQGLFINPLHITDAVKIIEQLLTINKKICLNLAGDEMMSLREISEKIASLLKKQAIFEVVESRSENMLVGNTNNLNSILNPFSKMSIDEGLQQILNSE